MKTRIQLTVGAPHGSKKGLLWKGDLPQVSGFPGLRIVLNYPDKESEAYTFKQVCLEINAGSDDEAEQVVYVIPVDRSIAPTLITE